jgi:predicted RNase H-like HicB family nuclease
MGDRQQTLRAVLYQEEGEWVAHCLDLDIVATAPTRDQAAKQLVEAVTAQIDYARDHQNYAYLYRPAPLEVWQRLAEAIQGGLPTITLRVPNPPVPTSLELQTLAA